MRIDGKSPPSPRSPSSGERTAGPATSPARNPEAPPGLRLRTAAGPMPGEARLDADAARRRRVALPAPQRTQTVQAVAEASAQAPAAAQPVRVVLTGQPEVDELATEIARLVPLIIEVKSGLAKASDISKRQGHSSFANVFDAEGNLRPGKRGEDAIRRKLDKIRASHPGVVKRFEAALASKPRETNLERAAADLRALVPLIKALKEGKALRTAISKWDAPPSFRVAFDAQGNLRTEPWNTHAAAIRNKLATIRDAYPDLAAALEAALASKPGETKLERAVREVSEVTAAIEEVKDRRATSKDISKRAGLVNFNRTFDADGFLHTGPAYPLARAMRNKVQQFRQSHPEVAKRFDEAERRAPSRPRTGPGSGARPTQGAASPVEFRVPASRPSAHAATAAGPLAPAVTVDAQQTTSRPDVRVMGQRLDALARAILSVRAGLNSLQAIDRGFPGVSRMVTPSGQWRSGPELHQVFNELRDADRRDFLRLVKALDTLLAQAQQGEAEASMAAEQRATPALATRDAQLAPSPSISLRTHGDERSTAAAAHPPESLPLGPARRADSGFSHLSDLSEARPFLDLNAQAVDIPPGVGPSGLRSERGRPGPSSAQAEEEVSSHPRGAIAARAEMRPAIAQPARQPASAGSSALSGFSHLSDLPDAHPMWDLNAPAHSPEAAVPQAAAVPAAQQQPASPADSALSGFSHLSNLSEARHFLDLNARAVDIPPGVGLPGLRSERPRPGPSSAQAEEDVSSHPRGAPAVRAEMRPAIVPPARQPASPGSSALSGFSHLSDLPDAHHLWNLNTPAGSPPAAVPQPAAVPAAQQAPASPADSALSGFSQLSDLAEGRAGWDLNMQQFTDLPLHDGIHHDASGPSTSAAQAPVQVQAAGGPAPEIIDLDQYGSPENERPRRRELRNNTWLNDRDIFDYTHVIIQRIAQDLGAGGFDRITQRMNFADSQQVSHLLNGDPTLRAQVLSHFNAPVVFLPVNRATQNDRQNHWSLLVVMAFPNERIAFHFDSLDRPNSAQLGVARQVTSAMGLAEPRRMPMAQQADGYSCGDHVLAGIEELTRRFMRNDFSMDLRNVQPNRQEIIEGLAVYDQFAEEVHASRAQAQPHPMQAAPRRRAG